MKKIEHEFKDDRVINKFHIIYNSMGEPFAELVFKHVMTGVQLSIADIEALAKAMGDNKAERIQLALDLAVNYDGMTEPDSLRSLIDDMVKDLKGEMEIIDIASHKQEGEEDGENPGR